MEKIKYLSQLLERVKPIPTEWLNPSNITRSQRVKGQNELELLPCVKFETLVASWDKALKWTTGLNGALAMMLASIISTKSVGDQLWIMVVSPPSTGKSILCEALSTNRDYVLARSTLRGFHSGYQTEDKTENHSPLKEMNGKTLVIKDGDTLLQSPNLGQILSEARDIYDGASRSSYRNTASREYIGLRITMILCGTNSLRALDSSELGERFVSYVIMDEIEDDLEDEILWRVANRADKNLLIESDDDPTTHQSPEMTLAMQLTGGYINHLRQNAMELLCQVKMSDDAKRFCMKLGKFVAFMRARPSSKQDETAEREFGARLVSQFVRLAMCLAAVLNRQEIDAPVIAIVKKVALDTARGQTLDIAKCLVAAERVGCEVGVVALNTGRSSVQCRLLLRFLQRIKAVESFQTKKKGLLSGVRWRLTEKMHSLYQDIYLGS